MGIGFMGSRFSFGRDQGGDRSFVVLWFQLKGFDVFFSSFRTVAVHITPLPLDHQPN